MLDRVPAPFGARRIFLWGAFSFYFSFVLVLLFSLFFLLKQSKKYLINYKLSNLVT